MSATGDGLYSSYTLLLLSHEGHLFSEAEQSLAWLCTATFVRLAVLSAKGICQLKIVSLRFPWQQLCSLLIWSGKEEFLWGTVKPNWVNIK